MAVGQTMMEASAATLVAPEVPDVLPIGDIETAVMEAAIVEAPPAVEVSDEVSVEAVVADAVPEAEPVSAEAVVAEAEAVTAEAEAVTAEAEAVTAESEAVTAEPVAAEAASVPEAAAITEAPEATAPLVADAEPTADLSPEDRAAGEVDIIALAREFAGLLTEREDGSA